MAAGKPEARVFGKAHVSDRVENSPSGAPKNANDCGWEGPDDVQGQPHDRSDGWQGLVAGLGNFSIQYNYACAGIAAAIMLSHRDETGADITPDYPEPHWAKDFLLSIVFVGSVLGMLTMGYLGDLLGNRAALALTNSIAAAGALASALLSWGGARTVWTVIAASRFLLGIGIGGNYPLSAAKAASASGGSPRLAVQHAARAFFWQGPGGCAPYVLALGLVRLPKTAHVTSLQFRILLGAGAIGPVLVVAASLQGRTAAPPRRAAGDLGQVVVII